MSRKLYDENCKILPLKYLKIIQGSMFTDESGRVVLFSEAMFKKAIKYSEFKSIDTLKIVMKYAKEINHIESDSYVVQCNDHAYVFSTEDIANKFCYIMEFMNSKFNDYEILLVYKTENKDILTFEIRRKDNNSNIVYLCIDTISEYIGLVRGMSGEERPNILVGNVYWIKFSDISYEKLYDDLYPRIEVNLDDKEVYYEIDCDVDSKIMIEVLKCFGAYRRGKFNIELLENSLFDNQVESVSLVKAEFYKFDSKSFKEILSQILRSRVLWQYVEPVLAFDKYIKCILHYQLNGLSNQVED